MVESCTLGFRDLRAARLGRVGCRGCTCRHGNGGVLLLPCCCLCRLLPCTLAPLPTTPLAPPCSCDNITISPALLGELEASTAPLPYKLWPAMVGGGVGLLSSWGVLRVPVPASTVAGLLLGLTSSPPPLAAAAMTDGPPSDAPPASSQPSPARLKKTNPFHPGAGRL